MDNKSISEYFEQNKSNPYKLEELYRKNKKKFINLINEKKRNNIQEDIINFWDARLNYSQNKDNSKFVLSLILSALCWLVIKLLLVIGLTSIDTLRLIPGIFSFFLGSFFLFNKFKTKNALIFSFSILTLTIYLNIIPYTKGSQSVYNAFLHSPILFVSIIIFLYIDFKIKSIEKAFEFIILLGELVIWSSLILLAGMLLTFTTFSLFNIISVNIKKFYMENIVLWGIITAPFISLALIDKYDDIKISEIIAKIFSYLSFITLTVYLLFFLSSDMKPYENRRILITYNIILVLVLSIILFLNSNDSKNNKNNLSNILLMLITLIIDSIALSAILYRIIQYGITPNKITVLGINLIMFIHLVWLLIIQIKSSKNKNFSDNKIKSIVGFLPVYSIWSICVIFILPLIFNFK